MIIVSVMFLTTANKNDCVVVCSIIAIVGRAVSYGSKKQKFDLFLCFFFALVVVTSLNVSSVSR